MDNEIKELDEVRIKDNVKEDWEKKDYFWHSVHSQGLNVEKIKADLYSTIGKVGKVTYVNMDESAVIVKFDLEDRFMEFGYSMEEIEKI